MTVDTIRISPADKSRIVTPLPPGWLIELKDVELANEFRRAPQGPHSEQLTRLLMVMKGLPVGGKPVLVASEDGQMWLARISQRAGDPLEVVEGPFASPPPREVLVADFGLRWEALFGERLNW